VLEGGLKRGIGLFFSDPKGRRGEAMVGEGG